MRRGTLLAVCIAGWSLIGGLAAQAQSTPDPNAKVKIERGCTCADPIGLFNDRCRVKDLSCPTPPQAQPGAIALTDFISVKEEAYAAGVTAPAQTTYGRVKVTLVGGDEIQQALGRRNSFLSRFRPQARGLVISVAAKAGAVELMPTTPMLALELPAPGTEGNSRTHVSKSEAYSAWVRIDDATALSTVLTFDSVSEDKIAFAGEILGRVSSIYTTFTGDQLVAGTANTVLVSAGNAIDQQLTWLADADGRDTRRFSGDGLAIAPAAGGRKALVYTIKDERDPTKSIATVRVEVELKPSMLLPTPRLSPADVALSAVPPETKMQRVNGVPTPTGPRSYAQQAEYRTLGASLKVENLTSAGLVQTCRDFKTTAADSWGLVSLDANLLLYEAIGDTVPSAGPQASATLLGNRCFDAAETTRLAALGRPAMTPPPTQVMPSIITPLDLTALGNTLANGAALRSTTAAKFADQVELVASNNAWGFVGTSMSSRDEALEIIAAASPKRFCCYDGVVAGRWTMLLDLGTPGVATAPMAADFQTAETSKVGRIVLRAPTAAETAAAASAWPAPAAVVTQRRASTP